MMMVCDQLLHKEACITVTWTPAVQDLLFTNSILWDCVHCILLYQNYQEIFFFLTFMTLFKPYVKSSSSDVKSTWFPAHDILVHRLMFDSHLNYMSHCQWNICIQAKFLHNFLEQGKVNETYRKHTFKTRYPWGYSSHLSGFQTSDSHFLKFMKHLSLTFLKRNQSGLLWFVICP